LRGQALALLGIENGVAFEERNVAFAFLAAGVDFGAAYAICIDNKLAGLSLPAVGAKLKGLLEGQPKRTGVTFYNGGRPLPYGVDAIMRGSIVPQRARGCTAGIISARSVPLIGD
jgi:hypothetical protein